MKIKFSVTPSFWAFVAVAVVLKQGYFACTYCVAVLLHECAHYVVANKLFYHCKEIRLDIFGAVLYGDFQDVAGGDRVKIALAGPACNFVLALACLALWWIAPSAYVFTDEFFSANVSMACVNLLPCYPLDGGRALCGALEIANKGNALPLTKKLTAVFSLACFVLFLLSLFSGHNLFSLGLFAVFLFLGVFSRANECYTRTVFCSNRRYFEKKGMEKKTLVFSFNNKLQDVAKRMQGNYLYCLEVVNDDMQVVKTFSVAQLERLVVTQRLNAYLKDFI